MRAFPSSAGAEEGGTSRVPVDAEAATVAVRATVVPAFLRPWSVAFTLLLICSLIFAWCGRNVLIERLASWAVGVDVTFSRLQFQLLDASPSELHVALMQLHVYTPGQDAHWTGEREVLANISKMDLRLRHAGGLGFVGTAIIGGLTLHYISYDPLFLDTSVRRIVLALGGDPAAAEGTMDTGSASSSSTVLFEHVSLRHVTILPQIRHGAHSVRLPPISLLDETLDVQLLRDGLSIALLNFLSSLVFRTIASTSIDSLGGTVDGGVRLLEASIGRALDIVDQLNDQLNARSPLRALPGAALLAGATRAARRVVGGAAMASEALVHGVRQSAKEVVGSRPTPVGLLHGVERSMESLGGGISQGAVAVLEGTAEGVSLLVDGLESTATGSAEESSVLAVAGSSAVRWVATRTKGAMWLAASGASALVGGVVGGTSTAVGSAAGGAARIVGGACEGAALLVGGVLEGSALATAAVATGATGAARAVARGDTAGILGAGTQTVAGVTAGGAEAATGVAEGVRKVVGGAFDGARHLSSGVSSGLGAVAGGVFAPVRLVANGVRDHIVGDRPKECISYAVSQRQLRWLQLRQRVDVCVS